LIFLKILGSLLDAIVRLDASLFLLLFVTEADFAEFIDENRYSIEKQICVALI